MFDLEKYRKELTRKELTNKEEGDKERLKYKKREAEYEETKRIKEYLQTVYNTSIAALVRSSFEEVLPIFNSGPKEPGRAVIKEKRDRFWEEEVVQDYDSSFRGKGTYIDMRCIHTHPQDIGEQNLCANYQVSRMSDGTPVRAAVGLEIKFETKKLSSLGYPGGWVKDYVMGEGNYGGHEGREYYSPPTGPEYKSTAHFYFGAYLVVPKNTPKRSDGYYNPTFLIDEIYNFEKDIKTTLGFDPKYPSSIKPLLDRRIETFINNIHNDKNIWFSIKRP